MKVNKPKVKKVARIVLPKDYALLSTGTLETLVKVFPFKPETLGINTSQDRGMIKKKYGK